MTSLSAAWQSAKIIRTREKISFFIGVMSLLYTALIFGIAPQSVLSPMIFSPHSHTNSLIGGYTLHTPSRPRTSSRCVPTNTRRGRGITSCSIFVIIARSSTLSTFGSSHQTPHCLWHATAYHMDLWPVLSSHGGTLWCSTTRTRLPHCSSIFMPLSLSL